MLVNKDNAVICELAGHRWENRQGINYPQCKTCGLECYGERFDTRACLCTSPAASCRLDECDAQRSRMKRLYEDSAATHIT